MMITTLCEWLKVSDSALELRSEPAPDGSLCWKCLIDNPDTAVGFEATYKTPAEALQMACVWAAKQLDELAGNPKEKEVPNHGKGKVRILYANHRGEKTERVIVPCKVEWKATEHHPEVQWILEAYCCERGAYRSFAMRNIKLWEPVVEGA